MNCRKRHLSLLNYETRSRLGSNHPRSSIPDHLSSIFNPPSSILPFIYLTTNLAGAMTARASGL